MVAPLSSEEPLSADTAALARDCGRRLSPFVGHGRLEIHLPTDGPADPPVVLPEAAVRRLVDVLAVLAGGSDATVTPARIESVGGDDEAGLGLVGVALVADTWPAEDFADWERAGE